MMKAMKAMKAARVPGGVYFLEAGLTPVQQRVEKGELKGRSMADRTDIAHLLRRTSFAVTRSAVESLTSVSWNAALTATIDQAAPPDVGSPSFSNIYMNSEGDDYGALVGNELVRLSQPTSGLGDRMLWFWHGLITSSIEKVELPALLFRQHQAMARNALGNFRQMMYDLTIDAAMLIYLDGNGSTGDAPNENYGREMMELFTMGRGNYTQDDVRAAAMGLAGWYIDGYPQSEGQHFNADDIVARFDPGSAFTGTIKYLGAILNLSGDQSQYRAIIDTVFDSQAWPGPVAKYICTKLYEYFVQPGPDAATVASLANIFRSNNYEMMPLLSALFRLPDFLASQQSRARLPLEVIMATAASVGLSSLDALSPFDYFAATGMTPFDPPNVAGWSVGNRWLTGSQALARARLGLVAFDLPNSNGVIRAIAQSGNPVKETVRWFSLYDISDHTTKALNKAAGLPYPPKSIARILMTLAAMSPEFALA